MPEVLVVCNLKAAKLAGFSSNGMVLCASSEDKETVAFVRSSGLSGTTCTDVRTDPCTRSAAIKVQTPKNSPTRRVFRADSSSADKPPEVEPPEGAAPGARVGLAEVEPMAPAGANAVKKKKHMEKAAAGLRTADTVRELRGRDQHSRVRWKGWWGLAHRHWLRYLQY